MPRLCLAGDDDDDTDDKTCTGNADCSGDSRFGGERFIVGGHICSARSISILIILCSD
jgi:hypothetical protein